MVKWLAANYGDILVILVLLVIVGRIIGSIIRDKKKGKSCGCGSCKGCSMGCAGQKKIEK